MGFSQLLPKGGSILEGLSRREDESSKAVDALGVFQSFLRKINWETWSL
jgi:hypothetical protein